MILPFKYYLHADGEDWSDMVSELADDAGLDGDEAEALRQKVGRPFYEVTLECTLDTETGEVKLLKTSL